MTPQLKNNPSPIEKWSYSFEKYVVVFIKYFWRKSVIWEKKKHLSQLIFD